MHVHKKSLIVRNQTFSEKLSRMDIKKWQYEIRIDLPQEGEFRYINSAIEALDCMMCSWPAEPDAAHRLALNTCMATLAGSKTPEASRTAFIAALHSAGVAFVSAENAKSGSCTTA